MTTRVLALWMVVVAALAVAASAAAMQAPRSSHVQNVNLVLLKGDRVVDGNLALAPGVPVRVTVTNFTREFHTITALALGVSKLIVPAHGRTPSTTTFTFTPHRWGTFAWHCAICPSGGHGRAHQMGGKLYVIVSPSALP